MNTVNNRSGGIIFAVDDKSLIIRVSYYEVSIANYYTHPAQFVIELRKTNRNELDDNQN